MREERGFTTKSFTINHMNVQFLGCGQGQAFRKTCLDLPKLTYYEFLS